MTWTTEVPKEEGYYWWRAKKDAIKRVVHIQMNGGKLHVLGFGAMDDLLSKANNYGGQWAGPIWEVVE